MYKHTTLRVGMNLTQLCSLLPDYCFLNYSPEFSHWYSNMLSLPNLNARTFTYNNTSSEAPASCMYYLNSLVPIYRQMSQKLALCIESSPPTPVWLLLL